MGRAFGIVAVLCGLLSVAGCAGFTSLPLALLVSVGLVAFVAGCRGQGARADGGADAAAMFRCLGDSEFDESLPPGTPNAGGWTTCCLRNQTRLCPSSPRVACNYGLAVTHAGDGTCSRGSRSPDVRADTLGDASTDGVDTAGDAALSDATDVQSFPCTLPALLENSFPPGSYDGGPWELCCVSGQTRACAVPPLVACNYASGIIFSGETCQRWIPGQDAADAPGG